MSDLDMDAATPPLDLPLNAITTMLQSLSLKDRFTCALVCKAWAEAAIAATHSIILRPAVQDYSCLQLWLKKHGGQIKVLQLRSSWASLTALPCRQLQDLLLFGGNHSISRRVWRHIAAATKLTSVYLRVATPCKQSNVVSALTALPNLQQLTWYLVICSTSHGRRELALTNSSLLQRLTKLTALNLEAVAPEALLHLGLLTKLQRLGICGRTGGWPAADCPGLLELVALTSLTLNKLVGMDDIPASVAQLTALKQLDVQRAKPTAFNNLNALTALTKLRVGQLVDVPASVAQLTALQQLDVPQATPTTLNSLQALTGLTHLCVGALRGPVHLSPPLQLPGLQHLQLVRCGWTMRASFLSSCTQLRVLELLGSRVVGPGRPVASTMLQCMVLNNSELHGNGPAGSFSWQQVFPDPLPHLTSLQLLCVRPCLQQSDMEQVVACCSGLQALHLDNLQDSFSSALVRLPGLTYVRLWETTGQVFSALAQLTGLRELRLLNPKEVSVAGLLQLTALEQLTSFGLGCGGGSSLPIDAWCQLRKQMSDRLANCKHAIVNKAPAGHPSDVPARLLHMCEMMAAAAAVDG